MKELVRIPSLCNPASRYTWKLTHNETNLHAWATSYVLGYRKPNYPMPAIRDVKTWDLWMLYRPYPASYLIQLRQDR